MCVVTCQWTQSPRPANRTRTCTHRNIYPCHADSWEDTTGAVHIYTWRGSRPETEYHILCVRGSNSSIHVVGLDYTWIDICNVAAPRGTRAHATGNEGWISHIQMDGCCRDGGWVRSGGAHHWMSQRSPGKIGSCNMDIKTIFICGINCHPFHAPLCPLSSSPSTIHGLL